MCIRLNTLFNFSYVHHNILLVFQCHLKLLLVGSTLNCDHPDRLTALQIGVRKQK